MSELRGGRLTVGAGRPTMLARDADGAEVKLHPLAIDGAGDTLEPRAGVCSCRGAFMLAFFDDDGARLHGVPVLLHTAPVCEVFRTVDDFGRLWTYLNTGKLPGEAVPILVAAATSMAVKAEAKGKRKR